MPLIHPVFALEVEAKQEESENQARFDVGKTECMPQLKEMVSLRTFGNKAKSLRASQTVPWANVEKL
jgi:hypothetical protein